jgi:hypothetical protein
MTAPRRLGSEDPVAAALFESARGYRPPARARRRTLRALGLPVWLTLVSGAVAQAASSSLKVWLAVGALTAASAGGGVVLYRTATFTAPSPPHAGRHPVPLQALPGAAKPPRIIGPPAAPSSEAPPAARPPRIVREPQPQRPIALRRDASHRLEPAHPLPPVAPAPEAIAARAPIASLTPSPLTPAVAAPATPSLGDELASLAAVEQALRARHAARARAGAEAYFRRHPRGGLLDEATVLYVAALLAEGDRARGEAVGRAFLLERPTSLVAERLRALLSGRPQPEQKEKHP